MDPLVEKLRGYATHELNIKFEGNALRFAQSEVVSPQRLEDAP
jgi:hypothetical protein